MLAAKQKYSLKLNKGNFYVKMTISIYRRLGLGLQRVLKKIPTEPPFTHVCQVGDPVLRCKSGEIPRKDFCTPHLNHIVSCMKKVMNDYNVLGLSACQIGVPVIINPEMKVISYNKVMRPEQCASLKGYSAVVPRYAAVDVTGYDEDGKNVSLEGSGLLGRVLQHEMDHINGKLYIDCMDSKTFQNDGWQVINKYNGAVSIHYLYETRK
ncbi:Peptide deformylase [Trinorchestia longiramus]|nr:Peptide deformylase [Trinorchestia longiramus]